MWLLITSKILFFIVSRVEVSHVLVFSYSNQMRKDGELRVLCESYLDLNEKLYSCFLFYSTGVSTRDPFLFLSPVTVPLPGLAFHSEPVPM
jgi:hypothetical protein